MNKITLNQSEAMAICWGDLEVDDKFKIIEDEDWIDHGKYSDKTTIFEMEGKTYSVSFGRSGSHFTDYNYDWEYDDNFTVEATEVVEVEVLTKIWKVVE